MTIYNGHVRKWYRNGKYHRENGPAIITSLGTKRWFLNGKRHRENGPAMERFDGVEEWWLDDKKLTKEQWEARVNKNDCDGKVVEIEGKKYKLEEVKQ